MEISFFCVCFTNFFLLINDFYNHYHKNLKKEEINFLFFSAKLSQKCLVKRRRLMIYKLFPKVEFINSKDYASSVHCND